jgi:hypothetical protein
MVCSTMPSISSFNDDELLLVDFTQPPFLDFITKSQCQHYYAAWSNYEPPKTESAVTFSDQVQITKTIHVADYSPEEKEATWYAPKDYSAFRVVARREAIQQLTERAGKLMALAKKQNYYDEYRGLKSHTSLGCVHRLRTRMILPAPRLLAVLDEQDCQKEEEGAPHLQSITSGAVRRSESTSTY